MVVSPRLPLAEHAGQTDRLFGSGELTPPEIAEVKRPPGCDQLIDARRVDENVMVFSFTAAVRDGYFIFRGTCCGGSVPLPPKNTSIQRYTFH